MPKCVYLDERVELVTLNLVFVLTYGNIFNMICLEPSASAQSSAYMAKKGGSAKDCVSFSDH